MKKYKNLLLVAAYVTIKYTAILAGLVVVVKIFWTIFATVLFNEQMPTWGSQLYLVFKLAVDIAIAARCTYQVNEIMHGVYMRAEANTIGNN